jgi:antitoxin YefM
VPIQTTYTNARSQFAKLCDQAVDDQEVILIQRRGKEAVAMLAASELRSLEETAHLLRSPENARRLLQALGRARSRSGEPETLEALRRELDLGDES